MKEKTKDRLKSRKLWVTVLGAVLTTIITILNQQVFEGKIPTEQVVSVAGIIIAYVFGQAHVDAKTNE